MKHPQLLVDIKTNSLLEQFNNLDALKAFDIVPLQGDTDWIEALAQSQPYATIIEVDQFDAHDYQRFIDCEAIQDIEFIFLSNGEPNQDFDQLMCANGFFHYRTPIDLAMLEHSLADISFSFETMQAEGEVISSSSLDQYGLLAGSSKPMHQLYRIIRRVAKTDANVLIVGESGSGKELVAQTIHLVSNRASQPFIAINCGALSPELIESELFGHDKGSFTGANKTHIGFFEQAAGGTLFLDEITEMPIENQVKLLRVLETGEYRPVGSKHVKHADVRVISATNRDPGEATEQQFLREDLYFRLAQFPIKVPPLRDRKGDIIGLTKHFIAHKNANENQSKTILDAALNKIAAHAWPGNVRELKNCLDRAFILANEVIQEEHLVFETSMTPASSEFEDILSSGAPLEAIEKAVIIKTLEDNEGNKTETAQELGISVKTLYNKLDRYESH